MFRLILLALLVGVVIAVKYLPWYLLVGGLVGLVVVVRCCGSRILTGLLMIPFRIKGRTLRGADLTVHSVEPATPPSEDDEYFAAWSAEDDAHQIERDYFAIDVTVRPKPGSNPQFQLWEPSELQLVKPGTDPTDLDGEIDDTCSVVDVRIHNGTGFDADEACKYPGEQRLLLHVGVARGVRELTVQYYFELFGRIELPAVPLATVPALGA